MSSKPQAEESAETGAEKRRYERVRISKPVRIEATLRGRFIDIMHIEMTGETVDFSRGGFLANVDQSVTPGVRCRVDFEVDDEGAIESLWGRVRRSMPGKNGSYVLALEFDEPLRARELLERYGATALIQELEEERERRPGD